MRYGRPPAGARVDPQDLAEQRPEVLRVAARAVLVAAAAAVAEADVEQVVGAEEQQAAVVVGLGLLLGEQLARRARVRPVLARAAVLDDPRVALQVGVVDVEAPAGGVVGREGHRQQAALAARRRSCARVEERLRELAAAAHDADAPALLDDEHAPGVAGRRGHVERAVEAPEPDEADAAPDGRPRGRGRGGRRGRGGSRRRGRLRRVVLLARAAAGEREGRREDGRQERRAPHPPSRMPGERPEAARLIPRVQAATPSVRATPSRAR